MPLTTANIVRGTVRNAGTTKQYTLQGQLSFAQIDVGCLVTNLAAAGLTAETAVDAVMALMQQVTPIGTPNANDPQCVSRYYSARPVESDDAMEGITSFVFNTPGGDSTDWTVESDASLDVVDTNVEYNTSTGALQSITTAPYYLNWTNNNQSSGSEVAQPTQYPAITIPRFYKTLSYTRSLYSVSAAQAFDNGSDLYVGCSNSVLFTGLTSGPAAQNLSYAPGTVMCQRANLTASPFFGKRTAVIVLGYKPEGWDPYVEYFNKALGGRPDNVWRISPNGPNGIRQTTAIKRVDLNKLLGLLSPGPALPFGGNPLAPVT